MMYQKEAWSGSHDSVGRRAYPALLYDAVDYQLKVSFVKTYGHLLCDSG